MMDNDVFTISKQEIISYMYCDILGILKDKGAPIRGHFLLDVDSRFSIQSWKDQHSGTMFFKFKRTKEKHDN